MKRTKLPIAIWSRGNKPGKKAVLGLLILIMLVFFFPFYLLAAKKAGNTLKEECLVGINNRDTYSFQLDAGSFSVNPIPARKQEEKPGGKKFQPIWPVEGKIIQEFGWRKEREKGFEEWRYVPGWDWEFKGVQEVKAVLPGKVELVEKRRDLGYTVILSHGQNLRSLYGYCSKIRVQPGEAVLLGQFLAQADGKFHFRILKNNQSVNPKEYF